MENTITQASYLRDAINRIVELANPAVEVGDGFSYLVSKDGSSYKHIKPELDIPQELCVDSLSALVAVIKNEIANEEHPLYVFARSCDHVLCTTPIREEYRKQRLTRFTATATDVPGWESDKKLSFTDALIALRTRFQPSADTDYLLRLLSDISNGAKVTFTDNGMASTIVSSKGVALQENAIIKPIVSLKPYRTFQEVEQPEGKFHIRISENGIRFIEADGGMWKLTARQTVRDYLLAELVDLIESGSVIITI